MHRTRGEHRVHRPHAVAQHLGGFGPCGAARDVARLVVRDQTRCEAGDLDRVAVVAGEHDAATADVHPRFGEGVAAGVDGLLAVTDQVEGVGCIADHGVQHPDHGARQVLRLVHHDRRVAEQRGLEQRALGFEDHVLPVQDAACRDGLLVCDVQSPHLGPQFAAQRAAAPHPLKRFVVLEATQPAALEHMGDLLLPVGGGRVDPAERTGPAVALPDVLEDAVGGPGVDHHGPAAPHEHIAGEAVHAAEVDAVRDVRGQALHQGGHHARQGPHEGGHQHPPLHGAGEVGGAVQGHDGLPGACRAADARRAVEGAVDDPGLGGVEERHPFLDRRPADAFQQRLLDLLRGQAVEVGADRDARAADVGRADIRGNDRFGDGGVERRVRRRPPDDRDRAGRHRREQPVEFGAHPGDLLGVQAGAAPGDLGDGGGLAEHGHAEQLGARHRPVGEDRHRRDLAGGQADLGEPGLGAEDQIRELLDLAGDILLAAEDVPSSDGHLPPGLGVDDDDAAGSDQDQIDVGARGARPLAVGEQAVAERLQFDEGAGEPVLARGGCGEVAGHLPCDGCQAGVLVGEAALPLRLGRGGIPGCHCGAPLRCRP